MNYTTGKYFLDTNFILYLFNHQDEKKRDLSRKILEEGKLSAVYSISTQVIKEFVSVMISKFSVDPRKVKAIVRDLEKFEVIQVNSQLILEAIDTHILHQYSLWDSLIIEAAKSANCDVLLSEDMNHNHIISGLKIVNPFQ